MEFVIPQSKEEFIESCCQFAEALQTTGLETSFFAQDLEIDYSFENGLSINGKKIISIKDTDLFYEHSSVKPPSQNLTQLSDPNEFLQGVMGDNDKPTQDVHVIAIVPRGTCFALRVVPYDGRPYDIKQANLVFAP